VVQKITSVQALGRTATVRASSGQFGTSRSMEIYIMGPRRPRLW